MRCDSSQSEILYRLKEHEGDFEILYRLKEHEFISIYQMIFQQDFSQDVVVTVLVPRASDLAHIVWRAGDSLQCWLAWPGPAK